ncbi:MAG: hypothetical protein IIB61_08740, partial [Planctomycetes bacterium]|nr:hypothetical protein [Planctomycetota bacterium]
MKSNRAKVDFAGKVVTIITGYPLDDFIKKRISRSLITKIEPDDVRQDVMLSILRGSDP